jgi:hypothetical protein
MMTSNEAKEQERLSVESIGDDGDGRVQTARPMLAGFARTS